MIRVERVDADHLRIHGLVLGSMWFPEDERYTFAVTPINIGDEPIIVRAKEWEELKQQAPRIHEYWPRFSRTEAPPRERLKHFYVPIKFGPCQAPPWLIHRDDWADLQRHF